MKHWELEPSVPVIERHTMLLQCSANEMGWGEKKKPIFRKAAQYNKPVVAPGKRSSMRSRPNGEAFILGMNHPTHPTALLVDSAQARAHTPPSAYLGRGAGKAPPRLRDDSTSRAREEAAAPEHRLAPRERRSGHNGEPRRGPLRRPGAAPPTPQGRTRPRRGRGGNAGSLPRPALSPPPASLTSANILTRGGRLRL